MKDKEYIYNSVGSGWYKLLEDLVKKLEFVENTLNIEIVVEQVKEKYGGLRFYYHIEYKSHKDIGMWYSIISDVVDYTERRSYNICEACGKHGKLRNDLGWIKTFCDEHYEEVKKMSKIEKYLRRDRKLKKRKDNSVKEKKSSVEYKKKKELEIKKQRKIKRLLQELGYD